MERSVLFGLSILTGSSIVHSTAELAVSDFMGPFWSSRSNDVPRLDGVEHALSDLLGVNLQDLNPVLLDEERGRRTRDGE
ncbi:hypothetical protein DVH24_041755 [Malus domestica]|uniref:Uncharacterized protein n=1 Tax=Malus domestica TaxID=3750 RepID=A0A498ISC7_MALDO|nr:hypothetical protein DVH24_041755 [Malus domestica]